MKRVKASRVNLINKNTCEFVIIAGQIVNNIPSSSSSFHHLLSANSFNSSNPNSASNSINNYSNLFPSGPLPSSASNTALSPSSLSDSSSSNPLIQYESSSYNPSILSSSPASHPSFLSLPVPSTNTTNLSSSSSASSSSFSNPLDDLTLYPSTSQRFKT